MTHATAQIEAMFNEKCTVEQIAEALGYDSEVVQILYAALEKKRNAKNIPTSINLGQTAALHSNNTKIEDGETAEEIYTKNQVAVARRIIHIGLTEKDNIGAAAKCLMYAREEATGRNDARAKKLSVNALMDIGKALLTISNAHGRVDAALGIGEKDINNMAAIDV